MTDKASSPSSKFSRTQLAWTLAFANISTIPLIGDVPIWPLLLLLIVSCWTWLRPDNAEILPTFVRLTLTLGLSALVFYSFRTISGIEPGTSLLLVMATMKILETKSVRDLLVLVFMSFFFILANFLLDQSLLNALLGLLVSWIGMTTIIQVNRRAPSEPFVVALRHSVGLLLQTLPLTLLLFVLFPRVPGPFWALPSVNQGQTGLSNQMEPGSISQLLQSSEVAFRVKFDDAAPPRSNLYFRGPVFEHIDGRNWSPRSFQTAAASISPKGTQIDYVITLEPHRENWLLALDMPDIASIPKSAGLNAVGQLRSAKKITERTRISLSSYTDYSFGIDASKNELDMNRNTQGTNNPETEKLALEWRKNHQSDASIVNTALRYFNQQPFVYTLNPAKLKKQGSVDQFLFDTREGFCEHYSSAFVLLMRHAGIPARVVTGYMGGEYNERSDHYTVRQSDAHAWAEVWLPKQGWIRVDPTGAVAPERVEQGVAAALGSMPSFIMSDTTLITQLRQTLDSLNALWNESVLGYSDERQWSLLRKLGLRDRSISQLIILLMTLLVAMLGALTLYLRLTATHRNPDPAVLLYQRFCQRLTSLGVDTPATEDPGKLGTRAALALPEHAEAIEHFCQTYERVRYGRSPTDQDMAKLKTCLKRLPRRILFRQ